MILRRRQVTPALILLLASAAVPWCAGIAVAVFQHLRLHFQAELDWTGVLKEDGTCIVRDTKRLEKRRPAAPFMGHWPCSPSRPPGALINWIKAAYKAPELIRLLEGSKLRGWHLVEDLLDLVVVKEGS